MINSRRRLFVRQYPMKKLPMNTGKIAAGFNGSTKTQRPFLAFDISQSLKNDVFQAGKNHRDTILALIFEMVVGIDGATDRATFSILPILALDKIVLAVMLG